MKRDKHVPHRRLLFVSAVTLVTRVACFGSSPPPTPAPARPAPVKWRQTIGSSVISPPAVVEGRLIFLNEAGSLEARDAATGAALWTHNLNVSSKRDTPVPVDSGLAFCVEETDTSSRMVAVDTGTLRWETGLNRDWLVTAPAIAD